MTDPKIRVLLIEDNAGDASLVQRYLLAAEGIRFELDRVDRLQAGLQRLERNSVDVVLLDLTLPDSEGRETFERTAAAAPHLPVVVMSGISDRDLALEAVREGAQDYLVKRTVGPETLVRALRYAIERKRFEVELRASEERFSLAVRGSNDGLWDWDLQSNAIFYSNRWKEMLGHGAEELENHPSEWFQRVHPADRKEVQHQLESHLAGLSEHFRCEFRVRHNNGSYRWMLSRGLATHDDEGRPHRMVGSLTDVHQQKMTEKQLYHDAMHDSLTDLANRVVFMDRLGMTLSQARRREHWRFAVLFLDVDRFKVINDSLGHVFGDLLLVTIAERLRSVVRPGDTVARFGGDEFAILLVDMDEPSDATRVAERVHAELAAPFDLQGHEIFSSISIGIAISNDAYERPEEMLRDADTAMYRAKSMGKAQHAIFDEEMHRQAMELLKLESDLRRAIDRREFRLHFQPIVDLASGKIDGFEALVRWEHPQRGLVLPDDFIPVAEETGLIGEIDHLVMEDACSQLSSWRSRYPGAGDLAINVNLSGRELIHPQLVDRVRATLSTTGIDPGSLRLEITEGVVLDQSDSALETLRDLHRVGVGLHLDDFGTGYSSLSRLHMLPLDGVKIDQSFVSELRNGGSKIVGTIVSLARSLDMSVAVEGLEEPEHVDRVRDLDCQLGQGYVFSRPVNAEAADQLLAHQPNWLVPS